MMGYPPMKSSLAEDELARLVDSLETTDLAFKDDSGPVPYVRLDKVIAALRATPVADTAGIDAAWLALALHETGECENWSPGYRYLMLNGESRLDEEGDANAHLRSAARILAALRTPKPEGER